MKAIVLAGGLGPRLLPLTVDLPKPMVRVGDRPLLEYVVGLLKKHGFTDITMLLYYQPEIIKKHFGGGENFGVKISYVEAKEDFGTAGAVKYAAKGISGTFLVISADLITDFNLSAAVVFHKEKKSLATMVLTRVENPLPYGIVILEEDGRIKQFLEKPSWSEVFSDTINCGIYCLESEVLKHIPDRKLFDFSQNLFPSLLFEGRPLYGFVADGSWKDIGDLTEYRAAQMGAAYVDPSAIIAPDAGIEKSVIGRGCRIEAGAKVVESIVWDNVRIGAGAKIDKAIIASNVSIGANALVEEGSVVGNAAKIGAGAEVRSFVKIWPGKEIEERAVVSRSVIWRKRAKRGIFGPYGVTGICNVEITPEFAASLGAAYGRFLGEGSFVSASRDSHKSSRMIFRALISGLVSSGVNVSDLEDVPIPLNRFEIGSLEAKGGLHVRKSPYDPEVIDIQFFNEAGKNLPSGAEKKIERLFFSGDFPLAPIDRVGEISFPYHRVAESYKEAILSLIDVPLIRAANFKIVVDYAYGSASKIFPSILGEVGVEVISLNAYIDASKITKTGEMFKGQLDSVSRIVSTLKADLGVTFDTGAEKIFLCDENGGIHLGDSELALVSLLFLKRKQGAKIAVPVRASSVIEKLVQKNGASVIRTKTGLGAMMEMASRVDFVGEPLGGFIFSAEHPFFDAIFSTLKILELMARERTGLSRLVREIPPINMVSRQVKCPAEIRGTILRTLVERSKNNKLDLTDGVKIFYDNNWILVLPDPIHPVIHLSAEAENAEKAEELLEKYENSLCLV